MIYFLRKDLLGMCGYSLCGQSVINSAAKMSHHGSDKNYESYFIKGEPDIYDLQCLTKDGQV
jgi:hypothetical protein